MAPALTSDGEYLIFQSKRKSNTEFGLYEMNLTSGKVLKPKEINILDEYSFIGQPFISGQNGQLVFAGVESEILETIMNFETDIADSTGIVDLSKAKKSDIWFTNRGEVCGRNQNYCRIPLILNTQN